MIRTYCYKLYNSKRNKYLNESIDLAAEIYNYFVSINKRYYSLYGKTLGSNRLLKHATELKKRSRYAHWNQLNSQAIQDVIERIGRSYNAFFKWLETRKGIRKLPPKCKSKKKYKSFTLKQTGYRFLSGNSIMICGRKYKYFKSRAIDGTIKRVTIKRNKIGEIYIFVVCKIEDIKFQPRKGNAVGLDFGLQNFITCSNGKIINNPLYFKKGIANISYLSKRLNKQQQFSNNWERTLFKLEKKHIKIENQRKDFQYKLAKELAVENVVICIQNQEIRFMQKRWSKVSNDLAISNFIRILECECIKHNTKFIKIDRYYPSSQICSKCGNQNSFKSLFVPMAWTCKYCGAEHKKNLNTAQNILSEGLKQIS